MTISRGYPWISAPDEQSVAFMLTSASQCETRQPWSIRQRWEGGIHLAFYSMLMDLMDCQPPSHAVAKKLRVLTLDFVGKNFG